MFLSRQIARQIAVPTNDNQVRARLREFGEAICLFGETVGCDTLLSLTLVFIRNFSFSCCESQVPDRRERLRELLAKKVNEGLVPAVDGPKTSTVDHKEEVRFISLENKFLTQLSFDTAAKRVVLHRGVDGFEGCKKGRSRILPI